jgi:hypothetical protein
MKTSAFGWLLAAGVLSLQAVHGATSRNWADGKNAGDLLAADNWNPAGAPAAGDTLNIARNVANNPVSGEFTFSADTPVFSAVTFARAYGKERSLNPGNGKTLKTTYLNFRYSDLFTIASGTYLVGDTFGVGNSTSNSDTTYLTVDGVGTFVKAAGFEVGTGSATVGQSKGKVTVSGGAVVDTDRLWVGKLGGKESSLTVTGEGTHFYVTNGSVVVGLNRQKKKDEEVWFYSCDNELAVTGKAKLTAKDIYVSTDKDAGDSTSTGNVFRIVGEASVKAESLYVKGTNSVFLSGGGTLKTSIASVGYWLSNSNAAGGGSYLEIADKSLLAATNYVDVGIGDGALDTKGSELKVLSGGKIETPMLRIGADGHYSSGNRLTIEKGGEAVTGIFEIRATNETVVAGELTVTNTLNIGRIIGENGVGSSTLTVDGGKMNMWSHDDTSRKTFYIGAYRKRSDANRVIVKNGGEMDLSCNYFYVCASGCSNELVVTGQGSRLVHNAQTTSRNFIIAAAGVDTVHDTGNSVTVSDGGYLETTASFDVGITSTNTPIYDTVLTVDQASVKAGVNITVGMGAGNVNSRLVVRGSQSRISAKSLCVGGRSSIVFDLSDACSSEEALIRLTAAPSFAEGSRIFITSSNPDPERAPAFGCTLISCDAAMDFSNVEIVIDPASGLRRKHAAGGKTLAVCGGLRPGMAIVVR